MENQQIQNIETLPPASARYVSEAEERSLNFLNPKLWQAMKVVAETFMQSGALPASIKNAQQLIMVLQAGYEAGLKPLEAMKSFYFVNGNLALYGEMAITLVIRAGHKIEWGKCDATTATVRITRKDNGMSMENTFTMAEAQSRKLDMGREGRKDPWVKFPENMLKFKAFHMTAKFVCPDAFHGNSDIGEVMDTEPIKAEIIEMTTVKPEATASASGHKPLEEALKDELPKPEAKPRKKKEAAEEEVALEDADKTTTETHMPPVKVISPDAIPKEDFVPGAPVPPEAAVPLETEEEEYQRLVNEEIEGRKLSAKELMTVNKYRGKHGMGIHSSQ